MRPPFFALPEPLIKVLLKLLDRGIDLGPEDDLIELVKDGPLEPFADSIGLRRHGLRFRVVDSFYARIELVFMILPVAAVFRAPIRKDSQD
jgi:hypothetical protein